MARIRTIKPEFFTSEDIVALSPMARLLYIALWCEADREGRMLWKPKTWKLRYFPGDDLDIDACARELVASSLVVLYGDGMAHIPSFAKHQHINPRESQSTLPEPPKNDASARVNDASSRVHTPSLTHREEGKGRERKEAKEEAKLPTSSGEKAPPVEEQAIDPVWHVGLPYLVASGVKEKSARSFLGQLLKVLNDDKLTLAEILSTAESQQVADPLAWLRAAADARKANRTATTAPPGPELPKASHRPLREVIAEQNELFRHRVELAA